MSASFVENLLNRLEGIRKTPTGYRAFCPCHQSSSGKHGAGRSLSIASRDDGGVLIHCHAGCSVVDVVAVVGLDLSDLFPPRLSEVVVVKGVKGWDWWSLASTLEAAQDAAQLWIISSTPEGRDKAARMLHTVASRILHGKTLLRGGVK